MIARFLVPEGARPPAAEDAATQRRRPTPMDERTLVPAMLPIVPLNGNSTIPTNLPLESIAARVVVPRDIHREAYGVKEDYSTPVQPTDMDERIAVPVGAAPPTVIEPPALQPPREIVEPDVFLTGEVNFSPASALAESDKEQLVTRISSLVFHILMGLLLVFGPKLFPAHAPTEEQMDLARRQMTVLLPPGALDALKAPPRPVSPAPRVNVDPRVLRKVAPPITPMPAPQPERPARELPSAPVPQPNVAQQQPQTRTEAPTPKAPLKLEAPDTPTPQRGLILPKEASPSETIENSMRASRPSGPRAIVGGGQVSGGGGHGGGGGGGAAYGGLEMLTPDQGVDFNTYLQRVYFTVKRNWFAVMPTSVELGERGVVVLTFRIMRDGSVPNPEPIIQRNSGKEPLDRAAFSSVRASSPFESLPPQFNGPYIELRYTYLYNIPLESYYQGQ